MFGQGESEIKMYDVIIYCSDSCWSTVSFTIPTRALFLTDQTGKDPGKWSGVTSLNPVVTSLSVPSQQLPDQTGKDPGNGRIFPVWSRSTVFG